MSTVPVDLNTTAPPSPASFPLERPLLRGRRRNLQAGIGTLPYFLCGEENRMVSYLATADIPVFELGNPLLLIGPPGVGKTAIALHLAARYLAQSDSVDAPTVTYLSATDFARQYAEAVAADDLPHLRQQFSTAEVLIVDDLHQIVDKSAAQEELALRIEERSTGRQPTILTCRRLPTEIRGMRPLLVSRVLPGLTVNISEPVGTTRHQLLSELAIHHNVSLSAELLTLLDSELETPLPCRSLEAAIKQIALRCRMLDSPVQADAVRSAAEVVGRAQDLTPSIIATTVAKQAKLKLSELRSGSRKQHLVRARSLAIYLTRQLTALSMHQIGEYFGGRDHTTILHAIRKIESLLENDPEMRRMADEVKEKLTSI